jgi:hypothetical protein
MSGEVLRRDFGVVVIDHAITHKPDVEALLSRAAGLMKVGAPACLLYHMSKLPDGIEAQDAQDLASFFIAQAPDNLRIALIHFGDRHLISLGEAIMDEYRRHNIEIDMFSAPADGEAWLRARPSTDPSGAELP